MPLVLNTTTQFKNSGILRYRFGALPSQQADPAGHPALTDALPVLILVCLGADADITVDSDNQAFGESPGHGAIIGAAGSLFAGSNVVQRRASPTGKKTQGNPDTGLPAATGSRAGGRIPAGSKVRAWFQASGVSGDCQVLVQTEVVQNRIYVGASDAAAVLETTGPQWLSSIRVAIINANPGTLAAGELFVEVEQSHLDIPGLPGQSMQNLVPAPPP
jgi:hypothetical protein